MADAVVTKSLEGNRKTMQSLEGIVLTTTIASGIVSCHWYSQELQTCVQLASYSAYSEVRITHSD
jgi:hypothetical protein